MKMFTAVVQRYEDLFVASCPEVGTCSQGATIEEAITHLKEATELYLHECPMECSSHTILATFEVAASAKA